MRPLIALFLLVSPAQLSESDRVRAELHQAKVQLLSCQEQLVGAQVQMQKASLTDEQAKLEQRFREILTPPDGAVWNWDRLEFIAPTHVTR